MDKNNVRVRTLVNEDREIVIKLLSNTMSPEYMAEMEEELDRVILKKQAGFAAESDDNHVIGYITCLRTTKTYKLETLAVDNKFRGREIGRSLLSHLERHLLNEDNSDVVVLNVVTDDSSSDPVSEFYKKCGFEISGIVKSEYVPGDRQLHLTKILREKKDS